MLARVHDLIFFDSKLIQLRGWLNRPCVPAAFYPLVKGERGLEERVVIVVVVHVGAARVTIQACKKKQLLELRVATTGGFELGLVRVPFVYHRVVCHFRYLFRTDTTRLNRVALHVLEASFDLFSGFQRASRVKLLRADLVVR